VHVIIGLGNPGSEYEGTRHNIGHAVIDALSESTKIQLRIENGDYLIGSRTIYGKKITLVKPLTYMNNSGIAVKAIVDEYNVPLSQLIIVSDDFNLLLGTLRLRPKGSDGGHNGLYSIIYHLNANEFPRLRCGIASDQMPKDKNKMSDFVLSPFEDAERKIVQQMIYDARDAALVTIVHGIEAAMNWFNRMQT
jgi:peptidyl-tRNA hydrolase, PTH1 family